MCKIKIIIKKLLNKKYINGKSNILSLYLYKKKDKIVNFECDASTQEQQNNNEDNNEEIIFDNDTSNTYNYKNLKKSITTKVSPNFHLKDGKRRSSYQDPELSFVTIHPKNRKKN